MSWWACRCAHAELRGRRLVVFSQSRPSFVVMAVQAPRAPQSSSHPSHGNTKKQTNESVLKERTWSIHVGGCNCAMNSPQRTPNCLSPMLPPLCVCQERRERAHPPKTIWHPHHADPPSKQVGPKPQINSSGGAKALAKPTPHPRDGDCFYL